MALGAGANCVRSLYTNLLEYDFGTTDGFKKKLLKWENQIVDFQKATSEVFSDRLKYAIVLSRFSRRWSRPSTDGSRRDEGQERRHKQERIRQKKITARALDSTTRTTSTARTKSMAKVMKKEKKKESSAKEKDKENVREVETS